VGPLIPRDQDSMNRDEFRSLCREQSFALAMPMPAFLDRLAEN
jgi:hypothetical protein